MAKRPSVSAAERHSAVRATPGAYGTPPAPAGAVPRDGLNASSADAARVHVEIGFLALDLRLDLAAADILPQAPHVSAALAIEDLHRREHLQHRQEAPVGVVLAHLALPLAADGEDLAV